MNRGNKQDLVEVYRFSCADRFILHGRFFSGCLFLWPEPLFSGINCVYLF